MPTTKPLTIESLISRDAADIAFVAEETPATTVDQFIDQLGTAARNLGYFAQIHGAEDLEAAATYLADAHRSEGDDRSVLLKRAAQYLSNVADMVDEYRDMV